MRRFGAGITIAGLLLVGTDVLAETATRNPFDLRAKLLDRVLPSTVESRSLWFDKLTVRYSAPIESCEEWPQSDDQLVLVTYSVDPPRHPTPECEIISYKVKGIGGECLWKVITRMLAQNPKVSEDEIEAALVVDVKRRSIPMKERDKLLAGLAAIRLPPVLTSRICVDACPRYEYWYQTSEEVVHYSVVGSGGASADQLTTWMVKFRSDYLGPYRAR